MKCKEFFKNILLDHGVKDVFGLPGGVILDFLESLSNEINPRLVFHEQSAVFSAIGYSRANNGLGVAYATRGPGITNTLTSVSDAYFDSVPVLIITGHSGDLPLEGMRTLSDQEIDIISIFKSITKSAVRVETPEEFVKYSEELVNLALSDRPGPVLLDVKSNIWNKEIPKFNNYNKESVNLLDNIEIGLNSIKNELTQSKKPILLLGDGFRGQHNAINEILNFAESNKLPILSGRFSQDLFSKSKYYFGYLGSHGLRSGNFIFAKSDLVISIGNRLHYPVSSNSWGPLIEKLKIIWLDIDEKEFKRKVPNTINHHINLKDLCGQINNINIKNNFYGWVNTCQLLTTELRKFDISEPIPLISDIFKEHSKYSGIISDVGNHEFWVARAYFESKVSTSLIFSKSFGAMGSALGKAIGFAHSTKEKILCFVGDQGLMMNIQELHYIAHHELPIKIFLMNNLSSGMIRSRQIDSGRKVLQTTLETGYSLPNFPKVVSSFGIPSYSFDGHDTKIHNLQPILDKDGPALIELITSPEFEGRPHLPYGNFPTRLSPELASDIQNFLEKL